MAQDLGQDFSTHGVLTAVAGLAAVAAGAVDDATEMNFNEANAPLAIALECRMAMGAGSPDGNQQVLIHCRWASTAGQPDDADNIKQTYAISVPTASVNFDANFRVPIILPYLTIRVENDQVAGPTATPTLKYGEIFGNQA